MRFGRWALVVAFAGLMVTTRPARAEEGSCSQQCGAEAEQAYQACIDDGGRRGGLQGGRRTDLQVLHGRELPGGTAGRLHGQVREDVATQVQNECLQKCDLVDGCDTKCQGAHDAALERCAKELCGEPDPAAATTHRSAASINVRRSRTASSRSASRRTARRRRTSAPTRRRRRSLSAPTASAACRPRCRARTAAQRRRRGPSSTASPRARARTSVMRSRTTCRRSASKSTAPSRARPARSAASTPPKARSSNASRTVGPKPTARRRPRPTGDACVANECGEPDPDCAARCEEAVGKLVAACVDAGFDEAFCNAKGDEARRHCIDEHCDDVDGPEPTLWRSAARTTRSSVCVAASPKAAPRRTARPPRRASSRAASRSTARPT